MANLDEILSVLTTQRDAQRTEIYDAYAEIDQFVRCAFAHRETNAAESKRLLNAALDIEWDITGDCKALGDLSEEWGVDYETDR